MIRPWPLLLLLGCLLAWGTAAVAGTETQDRDLRFTTRRWTIDQGAPDNFINRVLQDKRGHLWLGTAAGLARFDGVGFQEYRDTINSPEFGYNIRDIAITPDGSILTLPASGGLVAWKNGEPTVHPLTSELAGMTLLDLFVEPNGVIWVAAEPTSLIRWENGRVQRFGQNEGISRRVNRATFAVDKRGRTWVATGEYFGYYKEGKLVPWQQSSGSLGTALLIAPSISGGVWISSAERLYKLENDRALTVLEGQQWLAKRAGIQCLFEDSDGKLWIGTRREGLYVLSGGALKKVGIDADLILSVSEDQTGNIWVGTAGEGLCRVRPMHFLVLNSESGLHADMSSSVCEDTTGAIWCANRAGGLVRWKDGAVRYFGATGDGWLFASRVAVDRNGTVWMGSNAGLYRMTDVASGKLELAQPASMRGIHFLHGSRDGRMWVSSSLGLGYFEENVYHSVSTAPRFETLAESQAGAIWVATTESQEAKFRARILEFVDGQLVERVSADRWTAGPIHTLLFDHEDTLWIAAAGGLIAKRGDQLARFSKAHGLPDEFIDQILEDDAGNLWLAGRRAIFRVKIADLHAVAEGRSKTVQVSVVGPDDGLFDAAAPGGGQPRSWKGADGRLWFTLYRGVIGLDPKAITSRTKSPPLYVEEVLLDQAPFHALEPALEIPPEVQQVKLRLSVLEFSHPKQVLLRYKLEGYDRDWNLADEDRAALYTRIPPGNYRFVVRASDENGLWEPQEISLLVHVETAWWQSRWFILVCILITLSLVAWVVRIWSVRKYKVRLRNLEKEHALERERARIARNLHDELGGSLTQIGLLADRLRRHRNPEEIEKTLGLLVRRTQGLATDLESIVWTVSPNNNSWDRLASFIGRYARQLFENSGINCKVEGSENIPDLPLGIEEQHEVLAICKEAMNNVLKHSRASVITLRIALENGVFTVLVQDDGVGFEPSLKEHSERNGLINMRMRAAELGGSITIESRPGAGTKCVVHAPVSHRLSKT
ncbi:MAG: two-component regulator propeller domain-containing protein [Nibricoccus sp.]